MGRTPHSCGKISSDILWRMKIKQNNKLSLNDLRTAAGMVWGARLAEKMVRLAINSGLVVLPGLPHILSPSAKGRSA